MYLFLSTYVYIYIYMLYVVCLLCQRFGEYNSHRCWLCFLIYSLKLEWLHVTRKYARILHALQILLAMHF